jgi:hypothetical protein
MQTRIRRRRWAALAPGALVFAALACESVLPTFYQTDERAREQEVDTAAAVETGWARGTQSVIQTAAAEGTAVQSNQQTAEAGARQTEAAGRTPAATGTDAAQTVALQGTVQFAAAFQPLSTSASEIQLIIAPEGAVAGTLSLTADYDVTVSDVGSEQCIIRQTVTGTLAGQYQSAGGRLQGDANLQGGDSIPVSGCGDSSFEPGEAVAGTFSGQYDATSGLASGEILLEDGSPIMTFEARRAP